MENLHKVARAYYNAATETTKSEAQSLFKKMDTNGDGKVSLFEFKNYVKGDENRMKKYFDVVDLDRSGDLDFAEAVTYYYLLTVGIPECNNCSAVLLDTYFTCVTCSSNANNSFDLCTYCYNNNRNHQHKNFSKINSLVPGQGTGPVPGQGTGPVPVPGQGTGPSKLHPRVKAGTGLQIAATGLQIAQIAGSGLQIAGATGLQIGGTAGQIAQIAGPGLQFAGAGLQIAGAAGTAGPVVHIAGAGLQVVQIAASACSIM